MCKPKWAEEQDWGPEGGHMSKRLCYWNHPCLPYITRVPTDLASAISQLNRSLCTFATASLLLINSMGTCSPSCAPEQRNRRECSNACQLFEVLLASRVSALRFCCTAVTAIASICDVQGKSSLLSQVGPAPDCQQLCLWAAALGGSCHHH